MTERNACESQGNQSGNRERGREREDGIGDEEEGNDSYELIRTDEMYRVTT